MIGDGMFQNGYCRMVNTFRSVLDIDLGDIFGTESESRDDAGLGQHPLGMMQSTLVTKAPLNVDHEPTNFPVWDLAKSRLACLKGSGKEVKITNTTNNRNPQTPTHTVPS